MDSDRAVNIKGEYLDHAMNDLMGNLKLKRLHYFQCALDTPLEKIKYEVVSNTPTHEIQISDEVLYMEEDN